MDSLGSFSTVNTIGTGKEAPIMAPAVRESMDIDDERDPRPSITGDDLLLQNEAEIHAPFVISFSKDMLLPPTLRSRDTSSIFRRLDEGASFHGRNDPNMSSTDAIDVDLIADSSNNILWDSLVDETIMDNCLPYSFLAPILASGAPVDADDHGKAMSTNPPESKRASSANDTTHANDNDVFDVAQGDTLISTKNADKRGRGGHNSKVLPIKKRVTRSCSNAMAYASTAVQTKVTATETTKIKPAPVPASHLPIESGPVEGTSSSSTTRVGMDSDQMNVTNRMIAHLLNTIDEPSADKLREIVIYCRDRHSAGDANYEHLPGAIFERMVDLIDKDVFLSVFEACTEIEEVNTTPKDGVNILQLAVAYGLRMAHTGHASASLHVFCEGAANMLYKMTPEARQAMWDRLTAATVTHDEPAGRKAESKSKW